MRKIGIVATSGTFKRAIKDVVNELQEMVVFEYGVLDKGVAMAKRLIERHNVEVIISGNITGEMIKAQVRIPVIVLSITDYQLVLAVYEAKKIGDKICFLDIEGNGISYNLDTVNSIMGTDIPMMRLPSAAEAEKMVNHVRDKGFEVLICTGNCMVKAGREIGFPTVMLKPTREEVVEAVMSARSIIDTKRKEAERNKWYSSIVENSTEAIMTINAHNNVTVFNQALVDISGISPHQVIGKQIQQLVSEFGFIKLLYGDAKETRGKFIVDNDNQITVSRRIVSVDNKISGCIICAQKVLHIQQAEERVRKKLHEKRMIAKYKFDDIIGRSLAMDEAKVTALKYAKAKYTVLIYGESGTGKEVFCQSIHNASYCKNGPFLGVNCAAIQSTLLESELFGYEDGAFTGAKKGGKPGLFELAHGGTLFLDEIGEMPIHLQARLLRVLQEKEVIRIGGEKIIPIDTRIICATNKDLSALVSEKLFREDLFYRISNLTLRLPPLRERLGDIPDTVNILLREANISLGKELDIPEYLLEMLKNYRWPGNVRELKNFIDKLVLLSDDDHKEVRKEHFQKIFFEIAGNRDSIQLKLVDNSSANEDDNNIIPVSIGKMADMEKQIIEHLNTKLEGDKGKLAQFLGISRTTIWRRFSYLQRD